MDCGDRREVRIELNDVFDFLRDVPGEEANIATFVIE